MNKFKTFNFQDTTIGNPPDQSALFTPVAGPSRVNILKEHNANIMNPTSSTGMFACESSTQGDEKNKMLIKKLKSSMNKIYRLQKTVKHLKDF